MSQLASIEIMKYMHASRLAGNWLGTCTIYHVRSIIYDGLTLRRVYVVLFIYLFSLTVVSCKKI